MTTTATICPPTTSNEGTGSAVKGWEEDRSLVLEGLSDLKQAIKVLADRHDSHRSETRDRLDNVRVLISEEVSQLKVEVAVLKTKMALISAGVSAATSAITAVVVTLIKG